MLCIDYIGSLVEGANLESQLRKLVDGIKVRDAYTHGVHCNVALWMPFLQVVLSFTL